MRPNELVDEPMFIDDDIHADYSKIFKQLSKKLLNTRASTYFERPSE